MDGFITGYLTDIWKKMKKSIDSGLQKEDVLQGGPKLPRKARDFLPEVSAISLYLVIQEWHCCHP